MAALPPPRPDEDEPSASDEEPSTPVGRLRPSVGAVCSTQERREQIKQLVPALDFKLLGAKQVPARKMPNSSYLMPKKVKPTTPLASQAWPTTFADVALAGAVDPFPPSKAQSLLQLTEQALDQTQPLAHAQQPSSSAVHAAPAVALGLGGLAGRGPSPPKIRSPVKGSLAASIYASAYVPSQHFQQHLAAAEKEAKRKAGGGALDFLSKLELVEALEAQEAHTTASLYTKASPLIKGSPAGRAKGTPLTKMPDRIPEDTERSQRGGAPLASPADTSLTDTMTPHSTATPKGGEEGGKERKAKKAKKAKKAAKDATAPFKIKKDRFGSSVAEQLPLSLAALMKAR